jgi:hypothetical protein
MSSKWKVLLPKNQDQDREEQEGNLQVEVGNHQKSPEDGLLIRLITKIKMIIILMIKLTMRMRMLIWISL